MNYTVYKHTAPNGKVYIGMTGKKPEERWLNGKNYQHNEYFTRAIKKYGWENIQHEILFTDLSKEEAEQKEIELIAFYNSTNPEIGYNIQYGGNCKGKFTEETKRKISIAKKGQSAYWKGRHLSESTKEKLRIKQTLKSEPVLKIDLNGNILEEYVSNCEASRQNNIDKTQIGKCCEGKILTTGGFIFLKKKDYFKKLEDRLLQIEESRIRVEKTLFKKGHLTWNKKVEVK